MIIDAHIHLSCEEELRVTHDAWALAMALFTGGKKPTIEEQRRDMRKPADIVREMDSAGIDKGIVMPTPMAGMNVNVVNEAMAAAVREFPDRLAGFGTVDPHLGAGAVAEVHRCAEYLGLKGIKFHPPGQAFYPNDTNVYPIYAACEKLGLPVLVHTGTTWLGYTKIKYAKPELLDDVACDFRNLKIIMTHWSQPWWEENMSVTWRHANVYFDISGVSPKYVPDRYVGIANTVLQDKVIFGTDYPAIPFDRYLAAFKEFAAKLSPGVAEKIAEKNIRKLVEF